MSIFSKWRKRKSIVQYRKMLPAALAKDYGKSDTYFPNQVKATVERNNLNQSYLVYALALFCTPEEYTLYCKEQEIETSYEEAINEVDSVLVQLNARFRESNMSIGAYGDGSNGGGGFNGDGGGGE